MPQLNLNVTPEFEADLARLMKARNLRTKSEAIRLAVQEAAQKEEAARTPVDWSELIGLVDRLPGGRATDKTSAELLAEIDDEMDAKLERLSRHAPPK